MMRRVHKHSLQIQLLPTLDDISPWATTPKIRPDTVKNSNVRIKPSNSNHRLTITSVSR